MEVTSINILAITDKLRKVPMPDFDELIRNYPDEVRLFMNCANTIVNRLESKPEAAQMPKQQNAKAKQQKAKKQKAKQEEPKQQEPKQEEPTTSGERKKRIPKAAVNRFLACCLVNGYEHFVNLYNAHKVPQFMFDAMFGFLGKHMEDNDDEFKAGVIQLFIDKKFRKPEAKGTKAPAEEVNATAE